MIAMIAWDECELLDLLLAESGRPVTWLVLRKFVHQPERYKEVLRAADAQIKRGALPQLATMPPQPATDLLCPLSIMEGGLQRHRG
jgi:hypothetical protein